MGINRRGLSIVMFFNLSFLNPSSNGYLDGNGYDGMVDRKMNVKVMLAKSKIMQSSGYLTATTRQTPSQAVQVEVISNYR
jgi:hypothetical protein